MNNDRLLIEAGRTAWAILPSGLHAILAATAPTGAQDLVAVTRPGPKTGRVAQISVVGSISRRSSIWSEWFGGASVDGLIAALRNVAADPDVKTVLLNIDSPGGTVDGLPELAAEIRTLRESKHVVALANSLAASAAYWIASQADEIVATPEALIGSIGVFTLHVDWSAYNERVGIKPTYIAAGKYKTEANPDQPLDDEARDYLRTLVEEAYSLFVADVAKGRGVSAATVRSDYGEGRVLTAKDAKAAGLIDRVAGYHETIARLTGVKAETDPSFPNASIGNPDDDDHQTVGNSLAAKRLRLELLEKF